MGRISSKIKNVVEKSGTPNQSTKENHLKGSLERTQEK